MRLPDVEKLPEEERPKEKYYTDSEIQELLRIPTPCKDSPHKKRDRAVIALFLATGLRVSELCSLKIGDMKEHGSVYVRRKGGAWKTVDVAEFAYKYIDTYLATRDDADDMDAPLFVTSHGQPCSPGQMYRAMRTKQRKVVGDEKQFGNHVFRHKFVSDVEKVGGAAVARDLANHKSLVITNRYDHSTAEQRAAAVNNTSYARMFG
jgi:integrase/recombinase XerD